MYGGARADFVYTVTRDFVRNCQTPILVLPDDVPGHPYAVAMETVHLAPITMDQRNANGGESTGPVPVDKAWDAFADDQLGLMDHLGIREFFYMGYCWSLPVAVSIRASATGRLR